MVGEGRPSVNNMREREEKERRKRREKKDVHCR